MAEVLAGGVQVVLDTLAALVRLPVTEVQAPVVQVVLQYVQAAASEAPPGMGSEWAARVFAQVAPPAGSRVHDLMCSGDPSALPHHQVQAVADTLKLYVAGVALAAPRGEGAQQGVLGVLLPLVVEVASPQPGGGGGPHGGLRDSAVQLITHLATSQSGAAFKAVVAGLPQATKQRLQGALQAQAQAQAQTQAARAPQKPQIQLKNFGRPA